MKRSKGYQAAAAKIDARRVLHHRSRRFGWPRDTSPMKIAATVEVAMRLGVDPRKADQMVRGTVNLPHGTGKTARVIVFAAGEKADEARAAGADEVGSDELIERVAGGWTDFDAAVSTPDLMGKVGRLGKVLGPARSDAQPQDRHGDDGRRQGGRGHQGRQDRVPGRPARATCT